MPLDGGRILMLLLVWILFAMVRMHAGARATACFLLVYTCMRDLHVIFCINGMCVGTDVDVGMV